MAASPRDRGRLDQPATTGRDRLHSGGEPNPEAHPQAVEWLKAGLENLGAGAKTAAGYGYWIVEEA